MQKRVFIAHNRDYFTQLSCNLKTDYFFKPQYNFGFSIFELRSNAQFMRQIFHQRQKKNCWFLHLCLYVYILWHDAWRPEYDLGGVSLSTFLWQSEIDSLTCGERAHGTHWIGSCLGLNGMEKRETFPLPGIKPRPSSPQPVTITTELPHPYSESMKHIQHTSLTANCLPSNLIKKLNRFFFHWLYSPLEPWPLIFGFMIILQTVGLLGRVISSKQGLYLNTGQHKHRINTYTHQTSMPCMRFEPMIPASERAKTVHALDRSATVTGHEPNYWLKRY
jgi:hypothetical protein